MIRWIREHRVFTSIISVVLVLCIIISISYFKGTGFIGRVIQQGNSNIQEPVSSVVSGAEDGMKGIFRFKKIVKENEALRDEIERLEKEIISLKLDESELDELRQLKDALNYVDNTAEQKHVSATIIASDNSNFFNIVTINAGTECGIKEDCVVICGSGLVGRVSEAGEGYSKVVSVIDEDIEISFQVLRDPSILGVVSGNGNGSITGFAFKADAGIVEGDSIVTTGIGVYPEGIEIGKVVNVEYNSEIQMLTLKAEPSVDFKDLRKVMVLI